MDGDIGTKRPSPAEADAAASPSDREIAIRVLEREYRRGREDEARARQRQDAPGRTGPAKDDRGQGDDGQEGGEEHGEGDAGERNGRKGPSRRRRLAYWLVGLAVAAALVAGGVLYWLHARHFESTDDAFVDGFISQVAPQVAGRVTALRVNDNQEVEAGQPLVEIDDRDYQVRLDQARAQQAQAQAQLDQARAGLLMQQASLDQASAQVRVAEADLFQAQQDLNRFRAIDPKAITRQQLDNANAATRSAQARLDASRQAVNGNRAQVESARAQIEAADAAVRNAVVGVRNAELQLSYTHVSAPLAGRVTRRTVDVGNYVSPGQALLAVVPREVWVTANFKETQLQHMRPNQAVAVTVDAFPSVTFRARVDSFQSGSGQVFSALPAENATGNYVKVVQRVPVKITFTDDRVRDYPLAPGFSVTPRVTVR